MQDFIEPLEQRQLLAASTAVIVNGVLTITGTNVKDTISVQFVQGNVNELLVLLDGTKKFFSMNKITTKNMSVNLGGGDDSFEVLNTYGDVGLNSTILGGDGNDFIQGGKFLDSIDGGAGNDLLYGDDGKTGGVGKDTIFGGIGNDKVYGIGGNDYIDGGDGNDQLQGDDGNDTIVGQKGNDTLYGNAGNDVLKGVTGNDVLNGGANDDYLFGGTGGDTLIGGTNNDDLDAGIDKDVDSVEGDTGNDDFFNVTKGEVKDYNKDKTKSGAIADLGPNKLPDPPGDTPV
jgi:Ca2+-binding RTX toxin-like protein